VEVDRPRTRIKLSMRADAIAEPAKPAGREDAGGRSAPRRDQGRTEKPTSQGGFGAVLADALKKR
jgi:uncharacterized protein